MTRSSPLITLTTWVVVFDAGKAIVFKNEGFDDAPNLRLVRSEWNENPPSHAQGRDRPGRALTPDGGRTALRGSDPHAQHELAWVDALAQSLDADARAGRYDRLVVIAPNRALARFRARLTDAADRIAGVHEGDFTGADMARIERAFTDALA